MRACVPTNRRCPRFATDMSSLTWLFVPGSRPDRFDKALSAGADRIILDWEDAVAAGDKAKARVAVQAFLGAEARPNAHIRLNALTSPDAVEDRRIAAELALAGRLAGVMVAKAEDPQLLAALAAELGEHVEITALIESAVGVSRVDEIAAVPGVTRLAVGALDLAVDLGADADSFVMMHALAAVVIASRAAGLSAPLASPPTAIHEVEVVADQARTSRAAGFSGQLCIHPAQLEPIRSAFRPTAAELEWAQRVLAADGAAVQVDGHMVDKPVRDRAQAVVDRAGALS